MKARMKALSSTDLADETRRMELQLSRIKAEQAKLRSLVPDALPGTTRWSSAALPTGSSAITTCSPTA